MAKPILDSQNLYEIECEEKIQNSNDRDNYDRHHLSGENPINKHVCGC
jgi:hypothetical protein